MGADLFISYAWTSDKHREWVRLLAAQLKALGFAILIDADVDYGDDLNGFMRRVGDSTRVLLVADQNYVERADTMPDSGVGKENRWIAEQYTYHGPAWLSVLFIDNRGCRLPAWLDGRMPKGFDFNHSPSSEQQFPGAAQIEELWRWITGLPANRDSATPIAILRQRATRLEQQDLVANRRSGAALISKARRISSTLMRPAILLLGVSETRSLAFTSADVGMTTCTSTRTGLGPSASSEASRRTILISHVT